MSYPVSANVQRGGLLLDGVAGLKTSMPLVKTGIECGSSGINVLFCNFAFSYPGMAVEVPKRKILNLWKRPGARS